MNIFKKTFAALFAALLPLAVRAQDLGGGMLNEAAGSKGAGYKTNATIESIVGTVISAVLALLGVIFLVLTVYGGYQWLIARGDEGKVELAKETLTRAIIGLAIVLGAYAITYFVVNAITESALK